MVEWPSGSRSNHTESKGKGKGKAMFTTWIHYIHYLYSLPSDAGEHCTSTRA